MLFAPIYKKNQAIEEIHAIEKKYSLMNKYIQLPLSIKDQSSHEEECQKDYHQNSKFA